MTAALLEASPVAAAAAELVPGSPAWLAARRLGVFGSDAAAALNLSTWMTPYELWLDKRGELPPREVTDAMRWGTRMEPLVMQEYADRTGLTISRPAMVQSTAYPWMWANPDGVGHAPGRARRLVEGKTARSGEGWGEPGSADIPQPYLIQVLHYLVVLGLSVADVAVLIGGSDFRIYTVEADDELMSMIVEGTGEFWTRVVDGNPPPVTTIDDARRRWGRLNAKGTVAATEAALAHLQTLRDATEHRKDLEGVEAESKAFLMGCLGDAGDTLVDQHGKPLATWKLAKAPTAFDEQAFKVEHPGLYVDYLRSGTASRRFLLK